MHNHNNNNWESILKATCVKCKRQYRGVGAEVPKVKGEYIYNIPYKRRQQIAREWKNLGLEGQPTPRVCRECAPKVTREALEREGMEVHPASWRHATKNVNVCDSCKEVWLRNHGTQMDSFPEMWVKLTNDNTICDYVKNEEGDTRRIKQKKLRGGAVMKSMEEILAKEDEMAYFYHPDEHRWGTPEYIKEQEANKRKDGKEWARVPRKKLPADAKVTDKMKYHIDTVLRGLAFITSSTLVGPKDSKFLLNTEVILRDILEEE